jgi:archaemetzincin
MPIGEIQDINLDILQVAIKDTFGIEVKVKKIAEEPLYAYDIDRHQYYSSKILEKIIEYVEEDCVKALGIVDCDLCTPILSFVFGEAQFDGMMAVASVKRLRQEFYGLEGDLNLLMERTVKEAIHELAHSFGLAHCQEQNCVMRFSSNIFKVDLKGEDFCDACFEKLKKRLKGVEN